MPATDSSVVRTGLASPDTTFTPSGSFTARGTLFLCVRVATGCSSGGFPRSGSSPKSSTNKSSSGSAKPSEVKLSSDRER